MWAKRKVLRLTAVAAGGAMVLSSACSVIDIKQNVASGTMSFIAGYTADFLAALVPSPEDLVGGDAP